MGIAGQHGGGRGRLALDGVIGRLGGEHACAGGLQCDLCGVDRTGLELIADGKGRAVRSRPLGVCHSVGTVGGGGRSRSSVLDGLGNGQILHLDAGQHGDRGVFAALYAAVNALLMLLALCIGGCRSVYLPLPVVVGGFGVVFGFAGLLALVAVAAMGGVVAVGRPVAKVVDFHLEIVARCAGLDMHTGVHVYPRLPVGIVGMADRYGAACGFAVAGDCDLCRALCLSGHLAGIINLRDCGLVTRPSQGALCVDRLLHGGELIGRVKLQIYLCRGNGNAGKLNDGSLGHGDIEGCKLGLIIFALHRAQQYHLVLAVLAAGMDSLRGDGAVIVDLEICVFLHVVAAAHGACRGGRFSHIPLVMIISQRALGVRSNGIRWQGHGLAGVHRCVSESRRNGDFGTSTDVTYVLVHMDSPSAVGLRGVAAVLRCQCARSRFIATDGDAGDRTAGGHRSSGIGHGERSRCTVLGLEGESRPFISAVGVLRGGECHALALFDINGVSVSVGAVFLAARVRQDDSVQLGYIVQQHAAAADLGACRLGVGLLEAGVDVIGAALVQAFHRSGGDRRAGRPLVAGGGGAGGVDILLIGVEIADYKLLVGAAIVLLCLNCRRCRSIVVSGLADLHCRADDLAEIALRRDLHADADSIAHVSRHRGVAASGRAVNIRPCVAAVRAALPLIRLGGIRGGHAGSGGDGVAVDDAAGVVHTARDGGIGFNHRRFAHHQLNDMLVGEGVDGIAALFQIEPEVKGIDPGVCALPNGERVFGTGGNLVGGDKASSITGSIAHALGVIAISRSLQFILQILPFEGDGVIFAIVDHHSRAIPVLGVVDLVAVQRDGLHHAPCVGDDLGRCIPERLEFE